MGGGVPSLHHPHGFHACSPFLASSGWERLRFHKTWLCHTGAFFGVQYACECLDTYSVCPYCCLACLPGHPFSVFLSPADVPWNKD